MPLSLSERLTVQFYAWEQRGRGWHVFEHAVDLEPVFYPFFGHFASAPPVIDDSKRHTLISGLISLFSAKHEPVKDNDDLFAEIPPIQACEFLNDEKIVAYRVVLPKGEKLQTEDIEQLLLMLSDSVHPVSFEIIATSVSISMQFACRGNDEMLVYGQCRAYFPTAVITKSEAGLNILADDTETCVLDFGLTDEFTRPLAMAGDLEHDPYVGLFATLEHLQKGERGVIQILFKGTANPWAESIMRAVTDGRGGSFFADAQEMVKYAQNKVSAPLYAVCIKAAGQADKSDRAIDIARNIGTALMRLTRSSGNSLQILTRNGYPPESMITDVFLRESHRLGMVLNGGELATLVHFPTSEVTSPKVERDTRKTKAAPESAHGHKFILGLNTYHGQEELVSVPESLRLCHTHIIGATGTGKSTLLLSMISQDMKYGNGLAVLDPHGDLIESILAYVPRDRVDDVILVDPADGDYPVGFNVLSAHSEIEKDILSSDLVAAFRRLSTSWGDQMNSVLANAILAFLESKQGGTLIDLRRFLVEKPFRDSYLKTVSDPHVVYYWQHEYPLLKSNSIGSILTRLDTFLRPKLIRNMVAQKKGLDFENILDSRKILLVKLSQGLIGSENSFLLGTFFVSKMYQAAMARQAKSKAERSDFFLYIDEFQNFITPSMSHILSGARKYHLGLMLAHQDMQQLQKYDTELASSVVVNAGTRICFRLGDNDAKRFASGFSYFEAEDLENLHVGEAIARLEQPSFDFSLSTIPLPEVDINEADVTTKLVIATSREAYGTSKEEVEQSLEHLANVAQEKTQPSEPIAQMPDTPAEPIPEPFIPVEIPLKEASVKKVETQHRYLQNFIKRMAESRGYKAILEEITPDCKGRVDVSLEKDGKKIACEISVTTCEDWEVHNIEKCLAAGYDEVIVCSNDAKNLEKIKAQVDKKLKTEQKTNIYVLNPQEAFVYFDKQIVQKVSTEKVVKGYRVKVEYDASSSEGMEWK